MALESVSFVNALVATNPDGADDRSTADDHLRLIKKTLTLSFPNIDSAVSVTPTELNHLSGVASNVQTQINSASAAVVSVNARVTSVSAKISAVSASLAGSVSAVDARVTSVSARITTVSASLTVVSAGVASVNARVTSASARVSTVSAGVTSVNARVASASARVSTVSAGVTSVNARVNSVSAIVTYNGDTDVSGNSWVLDEDTMTANSAVKLSTQQSIKTYSDQYRDAQSVFVYRETSNQSIGSGAWTLINYNGELSDVDGVFDSATNYDFAPTRAGYYIVTAGAAFTGTNMTFYGVQILKGSTVIGGVIHQTPSTSSAPWACVSCVIYLDGSGDANNVVTARGWCTGTSPEIVASNVTNLTAAFIGS